MRKLKKKYKAIFIILSCIFMLSGCANIEIESNPDIKEYTSSIDKIFTSENVPEYNNEPYTIINNNVPYFEADEINAFVFEEYSELDDLGRCGTAYANICKELMPTEDRGQIGHIKPSGWQTIKYDIVDGKYLYNRCHLIGFQLAGENDNEKNLITGTRYFNVEGMLPFENLVADYVDETDNHVLYRVTPIYNNNNLVASGVLMEAYSVEDNGSGICFNVFVYNIQPGISIDYTNGNSKLDEEYTDDEDLEGKYIVNINSKKFHAESCSSVKDISSKNKKAYTGSKNTLINQGYEPCKNCNP